MIFQSKQWTQCISKFQTPHVKIFYLFLKKYIPNRHFELLESGTDSIYFSISKKNLDDCVPSHLKPNYFRDKLKWLTSEVCPNHEEAFIQCKIENKEWDTQTCWSSFKAFDKRTLGKMKVEYEEKIPWISKQRTPNF